MIDRSWFWLCFRRPHIVSAACSWLLLATLAFGPGRGWAADDDVPVAKKATKPAKAATGEEDDEDKIPAPEDLELDTKDGLRLKATYYPGTEGKKTVPIVIIHDFDGNRAEYHPLALTLQAAGHAVIVPDLRGHGDSTTFKSESGSDRIREIKAKTLTKNDFATILGPAGDLQAVRNFLIKRNNDGELNINRLCVIGVGMGATLGLNWTWSDWSYPPLAGKKQGQDVHGLIMVSPTWGYKGMPIIQALNHGSIQKEVSLLILEGLNSKSKKDADRIYNAVAKHRPEPSAKEDPKEDPKDRAERLATEEIARGLYMPELKAALAGAKLLNERNLKVDQRVLIFIKRQLVDQDLPWSERK